MYANTPIRGLTASALLAKSDRRIIQDIVHTHVKLIDSRISTAHGAGFNTCEYELPVNFDINNMAKDDAQCMIYSELLLIYKNPEPDGKGFDHVYLDIGVKPRIIIHWQNGMDEEEKIQRKNLIMANTLRNRN